MRSRGPVAAALAALIAIAPAVALPAFASSTAPSAGQTATDAVATPPKVVIVVGAVEGSTPGYRSKGDQIYAEAIKYTPNVVKLYSPNATWAKVRAAAQGASVFIYLGHGYGFPSPYRPVLSPTVHDGMGLNEIGGISDSDKKYYGESLIASDIRLAKNAVVLINHACYSAGSSEAGDPEPSVPVARQRVDNFAAGWIKAGARMVMADSYTSAVTSMIKSIFTTNQTLADVWSNAPNRRGHEQRFVPVRSPQFEGRIDPDTWTTGFYRSFVGSTDMRTTDIVAGAAAAATLAAAPDTTAPELWSVDGPRTLNPNLDGKADRLGLLARFSETVAWAAELKNANGDLVRSFGGTGHQASLTWDVKVGGVAAPPGDYTWTLKAADAAGNAAAEASGPFTVEDQPIPDTGVQSFGPTTPTMTTSGSISYALTFTGPVTGLTVGDFTRTGSAPDCVLGAPVGSGAAYTIAITGCSTGSVGLYLNQGTVTGASSTVGPQGPIVAATVIIDRAAPKTTAPKPSLRTGVALPSASTSQPLLAKITWSGTDSGSGIKSYDVARSVDGGAFATIASATTATSMDVNLTPGHSYRFRVRARDKAGNVGAWAASYTWNTSLVQNQSASVVYGGTWAGSSSAEHSGAWAKYSTTAGATATYTFSGRAVAVVTTLRGVSGEVQVWVDGALAATVDTHADATTYRQVVFSRAWGSYASHTIQLVVVGTLDHGRFDLDALEVIR